MRLGVLAADATLGFPYVQEPLVHPMFAVDPYTPPDITGVITETIIPGADPTQICYDSESGVNVYCATGQAVQQGTGTGSGSGGGGGTTLQFPYVAGQPVPQQVSPFAYLGGNQPVLQAQVSAAQAASQVSSTTWMILAAVIGGIILLGNK